MRKVRIRQRNIRINQAKIFNDDLSKRSVKYKLPMGLISCPHCGYIKQGVVYQVCPSCNKNVFETTSYTDLISTND